MTPHKCSSLQRVASLLLTVVVAGFAGGPTPGSADPGDAASEFGPRVEKHA